MPLRRRPGIGLGLAVCFVFTSCNTLPLGDRSWIELRTLHYDIISSLDADDTAALARDAEHFRRAAEYVLGRPIPPPPIRTRIYAFDGRSVRRPFDVGGEASYLLPRLRGDVIVLRGGGGWADATTAVRLRYARRLFRTAGSLELPLWYDEGFPQLASTLQIRGDHADVGILREDHVRLLRAQPWVPIDRVLGASDLEGWSASERERFEAESWVLAHYLGIERGSLVGTDAGPSRYLAMLRRGDTAAEAADATFGGSLDRKLHRYVRDRELDSIRIALPSETVIADATPRALSRDEVFAALASLSLALGRARNAMKYFGDGSEVAQVEAGVGVARALEGRDEDAELRFAEALSIAPDDPVIHLDYGNLQRARALASTEGSARARFAALAREHYRRSLELDDSIPETHFMLGGTYLIEGQDARRGIAHSERAHALLPASLETRLLRARLELKLGNRYAARAEAVEVLSRGRRRETLAAARALIEQISTPEP